MRSLIPLTCIVLSSLLSFSVAGIVAAPQGRDESQYTITLNASLVVFNLTVTDSKGRQVSGLNSGDFHVSEDNRPQEITLFAAEDVPATVGLIVDESGSMAPKREDVINAALAFANASNPGDEMFVINFNENVYPGLPLPLQFTSDRNEIRKGLLRTPPAGRTALYDAMAAGIEHLKSGTLDRKALVVVSDGGDNASRRRLVDVLKMAQRSSATIYAIGIYDETDVDRNPRVLRKIAELTGGRSYFPGSSRDQGRVWNDIAGGIRSQYTIGFHSSNPVRDGSFRKVKITAGRNGGHDLRVTTRDGYFAADRE